MKFAAAASLVLATAASAGGLPPRHARLHKKDAAPAATEVLFEKRSPATDAVNAKLSALGFSGAGVNAASPNGGMWLGGQGPYSMDLNNDAGEDITVVCWGAQGSWVNAVKPQITVPLAAKESKTLSFATGASGACSAVYGDTQLKNGQVADTWIEFTFGPYGVVDISREVNMDGHPMKVEGPTCQTDMDTCVFVCPGGQKSCWTEYELVNCDPKKQKGAQFGTYFGAPSGGCGGLGTSAHLKATFS